MNYITERFINNPSYLDNGAGFLANRWNVSPKEVREARVQARKYIQDQAEIERPFKRLFFDIETSPCVGWFWRPGYKVRLNYNNIIKDAAIICVSYKWEGEDKVYNLKWDNWDDRNLLKEFVEIMDSADECIGHNSERFDTKWLRTRALKHGIPFSPVIKQLDTLQKARYYFNFPSNRLNDIGQYLGVGEKLQTSPDLWNKVCFDNDQDALEEMIEYCNMDVVLLEDIYQKLKTYTDTNTHVGVHQGKDKWTCPIDGSENVSFVKSIITKAGTIQRLMKCNDCKTQYKISNTAYKKYLDK